MADRRALITGITGQDGSYLAELLLAKGYEVHGIIRRSSSFNTGRIAHIFAEVHDPAAKVHLHYGDMSDELALERVLDRVRPSEIYHLAAQSHVRISFDQPVYTTDIVATGTMRLLEAIRNVGLEKVVRFYQASSSEMFGNARETPQRETTPFAPLSPYACAKVLAYHAVVAYRQAYGLHASNGILFNHESPRRGETFVTRKITRGIAQILAGKLRKLYLGNLEARRDWGFAGDYVGAMWLMLQQDRPDDFVVSTGEGHSVMDFLSAAFGAVRLDWHDYVEVDPRYFRPNDVDVLIGDSSKARRQLNWSPTIGFRALVRMMLEADLEAAGVRGIQVA